MADYQSGPLNEGFENLRVFPIDPTNTDVQESKFIENNRFLKNEHQFNYVNIPGSYFPGISDTQRMQLTFESGLEDEINHYLNNLISISYTNPVMLNLKGTYGFLLDYLAIYLSCFVFDSNSTNIDINKSLDSSLILRNLVQDIENSQVVSMNSLIKETLLKILGNEIILNDEFSNENYEALKELLRYSMDIVESISSYLAPASYDDPLFKSLIKLLHIAKDRSSVITILRSLSRLMYNSQKSGDAPDHLDDEVLNKVVSYLALSVNSENDNDELILTSLDFLYQFILPNRTEKLISSYTRKTILQSFLPKLLIYKLDYKTEFTQNMPLLRLVKRVKDPVPTKPPSIPNEIILQMNKLSEPERATAWMRSSYKANPDGEVTQISLWRSYESQFSQFVSISDLKLLPAVDFIKNVQHSFPLSNAMVINQPDGTRKFIIKGIEPRSKFVDIEKGKVEALSPYNKKQIDNDFHPELKKSIQEPYELFQYNFNDYLKLNEVNTSTSIFINQLISSPKGKELFEGKREEFVDDLMKVPNLLPYIYEVIQKLEY